VLQPSPLTLQSCIGEVTTSSVACGVLGVGGNKGAVAAELTLHRRKVATICSHFAAHQVRPLQEPPCSPRSPSGLYARLLSVCCQPLSVCPRLLALLCAATTHWLP
jgi:hypothetical protein